METLSVEDFTAATSEPIIEKEWNRLPPREVQTEMRCMDGRSRSVSNERRN
jgi:hypothetical protein